MIGATDSIMNIMMILSGTRQSVTQISQFAIQLIEKFASEVAPASSRLQGCHRHQKGPTAPNVVEPRFAYLRNVLVADEGEVVSLSSELIGKWLMGRPYLSLLYCASDNYICFVCV